MVDRLERLTNLLALLLETHEPLSLTQIAGELAGQYPDVDRNRRAAFERDKAALRSIGVPIDTRIISGGPYAGQTRYSIDRRAYELADLELTDEEVHAVQVAVAAVHTGTSAGTEAIRKLGGSPLDTPIAVTAVVPDRAELPELRAAIARRSTVEFGYRGEDRTVDPWGLLLRGGFWYLVGHDRDREAKRTFRLDRIDHRRPTFRFGESGGFERPSSFDPQDAFPADPKQIGHAVDDELEATVRIDAHRAGGAVAELGDDRVLRRHPDGAVDVSVPTTNRDAFRSWVLGLAEHAVVIDPPELRVELVEWLRTVAGGAAPAAQVPS